MKIRVWTFVNDGGDGSVYVIPFKSEEEANAFSAKQEELYGYVLDEAVGFIDIEVENGEVVSCS